MSDQSWRTRLESVRANCQVEGWDSYGAAAVTDKALHVAEKLCESLDISPSNDGGVSVTLAAESVQITISPAGFYSTTFLDTEELDKTMDAYRDPA